jgi:hypothetical protein
MSIGWALRGSIGGGPLGAMIPGALFALAIAHNLRYTSAQAAIFVALSALGIGLGGQETYGQTIGLLRDPETRYWGLAGLTLKGAVWGLLGGAIMALSWQKISRPITLSLALMAATQAGWQFLNEPKLLYFSNRYDRPRQEIYAGLLLSALAVLWIQRSRFATTLALAGALGGAIGFGGGSFFNLVPIAGFPGWKCMEWTFGLLLGAAFALVIYRHREELPTPAEVPASRLPLLLYPLLAVLIIGLNERLPLRYSYTAVVALMLLVLARLPQAAWPTGFHVTLAAACVGLYKTHPLPAVALAVLPAYQTWKQPSPGQSFLLLLLPCCLIYVLEYWIKLPPK